QLLAGPHRGELCQLSLLLHVADAESWHLGDGHRVGMRAVFEMQGAPHPVDRPPVPRTPRMVALTHTGKLDPLVIHADAAGDPAGDLVAGGLPPGIGDARRIPDQVELYLDRGPRLAPQGCGLV